VLFFAYSATATVDIIITNNHTFPPIMYFDNLKGQTFVVIGASSGIGRALASALLVIGAAKVHIASSNEQRINKAVEDIRKEAIEGGGAKGEIVGSVIDLKSEDKVKEWFEKVGKFDHLVIT
jgi:NAD(P)-dependent dehydrogenase (short-subunit alcohol dehydrogenase family)